MVLQILKIDKKEKKMFQLKIIDLSKVLQNSMTPIFIPRKIE